jgi:hypothetical protein
MATAEQRIKHTRKCLFVVLNYNFFQQKREKITFRSQNEILSHNYESQKNSRIFCQTAEFLWWDWRTNLAKAWQQWPDALGDSRR